MEYDEKTQSYKCSAADLVGDDIIDWLENCPISAFGGSWFQLTPAAKNAMSAGDATAELRSSA